MKLNSKRYFIKANDYFNWINTYKDVYQIIRVYLTNKYIVIEYSK